MKKTKKKVVIINHFAGAPNINERSLRHFLIAKELIKKEIEVTIITSQNHYQSINPNFYKHYTKISIDKVNFIFVNEFVTRKNNLFTKLLKMFSFSFNLFISFLFKRIKINNPDIVISSSPDLFTAIVGYFYSKRVNAAHFIEVRDLWPLSQIIHHDISQKNIFVKFLKKIELFLYRNSKHIFSTCHKMNLYLDEHNIKTPFTFVPHVVYNYKLPNNPKKIDSLKKYDLVGVYAGNIAKYYKIDQIIDYFPTSLKEKIGIIIVGSGDDAQRIRDKINNKMDNFIFSDSLAHDKLSHILLNADFGIITLPDSNKLYRYGINLLKTNDYMYHKLPILFCGNPNFTEIKNENLISCKFNDKSSFQETLKMIHSLGGKNLKLFGDKNARYIKREYNSRKISEIFYKKIIIK